jgi:hypothetical protein
MGIGGFRENSSNMVANRMKWVVNFGAKVNLGILKTGQPLHALTSTENKKFLPSRLPAAVGPIPVILPQ